MKAFDDLPDMTVDEFLKWEAEQPGGRYELEDGRIVAMAAERAAHARVKTRIASAFERALREEGSTCEAYAESLKVRVDATLAFEPDVLIDCYETYDPDALEAQNPVVVVEVASPSTSTRDLVTKLPGYMRVPSIRHYLIVKPDERLVVHFERQPDGSARATFHNGGRLRLDPPGVDLDLDAVYA